MLVTEFVEGAGFQTLHSSPDRKLVSGLFSFNGSNELLHCHGLVAS